MSDKKQHLLVIRLSAMGDVAMTAPVLKAVQKANPNLRITLLTRSFFKPFFSDLQRATGDVECDEHSNEPLRFDIIVPDFKGRHKGLIGIIRLYRDILACGVTHVADLHDVIRTKLLRPLLRLSGCKVVKLDKGRADKRAITRKHQKIMKQLTPTVERYRQVIEQLGFAVAELVPEQRHIKSIPQEILKIAGEKKGIWIGVAPFAKHQGKIYPTLHVDKLIGILTKKYERVFIFGGGPNEREFAEAMESRHKGAVSVIGRIRLGCELNLIANLEAIVTMDSAAMHMASLVGTPAVSIWGGTHPYVGFYGFGQDPDNAVQVDLPCRPCSVYGDKHCLFKDYRCMEQIKPEMVVQKIAKIVDARED